MPGNAAAIPSTWRVSARAILIWFLVVVDTYWRRTRQDGLNGFHLSVLATL
jgi:hypothetical protein